MKKMLSLVLAVVMILSSASVFAENWDLLHKTDPAKHYKLIQIFKDINAFKDVATNIDKYVIEYEGKYYNAKDVNDYVTAHPNAEDAEIFGALTDVPKPITEDDLEVIDITIKSATEIHVTLNHEVGGLTPDFFNKKVKGVTVQTAEQDATNKKVYVLTIAALAEGASIEANGKTYIYHSKVKVEKMMLDNYRQLRIQFNTTVDHDSATKLSNFYFYIVDGNANQDLVGTKLEKALSFYELDDLTQAGGGTNGPDNKTTDRGVEVAAEDVDGKTVVTFNFPEDGRFTNVLDTKLIAGVPADHEDRDDEKTIQVQEAADSATYRALTKDSMPIIAVRNITKGGKYIMDTHVEQVLVQDKTAPQLKEVFRVISDEQYAKEAAELAQDILTGKTVMIDSKATGAEVKNPGGYVDKPGVKWEDRPEVLRFKYDEPVFDAHDIRNDKAEDVKVQIRVNNQLVAQTGEQDNNAGHLFGDLTELAANQAHAGFQGFEKVVRFDQTKEVIYDKAKFMELNLFAAINNYWILKETNAIDVAANLNKYVDKIAAEYTLGKTYDITVAAVTDLAGNLQSQNIMKFEVELVAVPGSSGPGSDPKTPPVFTKVVQKADNVVRVYFKDVKDPASQVKFDMIIKKADNLDGTYRLPGLTTAGSDEEIRWLDVYLEADDIVQVASRDQILGYRNQDVINREFVIEKIELSTDATVKGKDDRKFLLMENDTQAPKAIVGNVGQVQASETPQFYDAVVVGDKLLIQLSDMFPKRWEAEDEEGTQFIEGIENEVLGLKYKYDVVGLKYTNDVDMAAGNYLPIKVSYTTPDGRSGFALVSNEPTLKENPGFVGSIAFQETDGFGPKLPELMIDLNPADAVPNPAQNYVNLLDSDGKLIEGATYKVEIPKGYFADAGYDIQAMDLDPGFVGDYAVFDDATAATDDILHVDQSRNITPPIKYGLSNREDVVTITLPVKKIPDAPDGLIGVPQTSHEMITYDVANNVVKVQFTGKVDPATATNLDNYTLSGKKLSEYKAEDENDKEWKPASIQWYEEVAPGANGEKHFVALISLPSDSVFATDWVDFTVENVATPQSLGGGMMTPVHTKIKPFDNRRPIIKKAFFDGSQTLTLTFDEVVMVQADQALNSIAKNFKLLINGNSFDFIDVESVIGQEVKLVFAATVTADMIDAKSVEVQIVINPDGKVYLHDMSELKNVVRIGQKILVVRD